MTGQRSLRVVVVAALLAGALWAVARAAEPVGAAGGPARNCLAEELSGNGGKLRAPRLDDGVSRGRYQQEYRRSGCLRLNHVQVVGTHNSYHVEPAEGLKETFRLFGVPELIPPWEYTHRLLAEQFEQLGIRQIELDVFRDDAGGLYADPLGPRFAELLGQDPGPPNDPDGVLLQPGLKVLHVQDVDYRSTCLTFVICLQQVEEWSTANPGHLPIMILVEAKDDPIVAPDGTDLGFVVPEPFDRAGLDQIDADIRSVFDPDRLITPDDVRDDHATLEQAVLEDGWPALFEARGRVLFALDNGGADRAAYIAGRPSLEGAAMFTGDGPGTPDAAFVKRNDPVGGSAEITDLVGRGYLVRTRADADTVEARSGDSTRRDAALAGGGQFVSTDWPEPATRFGTGYVVRIPGTGVARCNPVSAPVTCAPEALDDP